MKSDILLSNVSAIVNKYDAIKKEQGGYFNIFQIAKIDQLEVTVCRVLHDLLNPKGSHYQGNLFLKEFLDVIGFDFSLMDYETVAVYREYAINNNRRIDLFIKTINYSIPIEIKIHAEDQANQCKDYFDYAKTSKLIYITKYGTEPSEKSLGNLSLHKVACFSFEVHIIEWLERCLNLQPILSLAPIREVLIQLIKAIKDFTNQTGDDEMHEIEQLVSTSSESMKNALLITEAVNKSRIVLLKKIFSFFEKNINLKKELVPKDYAFNNYANLEKYYKRNVTRVLPGLHYFCEKSVVGEYDLWFSIELDHHLYAGFYLEHENKKKALSFEELMEILPHLTNVNSDASFIYWQYLSADKGANFFEAGMNENYIRLFDDNYLEQFLMTSLREIERIYGKPLKR